MSGVGSSPALATCETSQVLLVGLSGGFPGVLLFRPTYRLARLDMSAEDVQKFGKIMVITWIILQASEDTGQVLEFLWEIINGGEKTANFLTRLIYEPHCKKTGLRGF